MVENLQGQKDLARAEALQTFSNIDYGKLSPDYRSWLRSTGLQRAQRTEIMLSNDSKRILNKFLDQSEQLRLNVMASQYYDMMAAGHMKYQQVRESIARQILYKKQGAWYDSMTNNNNGSYKQALALADDYISAMSAQYESESGYYKGFGSKSFEAGRKDAESKSFRSLMDRWNYNKRFYVKVVRPLSRDGMPY